MPRPASIDSAVRSVRRAVPSWAWTALGTLSLLGLGYLLLAAAPALSRRAQNFVAQQSLAAPSAAWVDTLMACGVTLGGGAALVLVLARLAREVERRPYSCFAPVLAAFSTSVAVGLQAELPLKGLGTEHLAVMVMSATCVGGALVMASRLSAQLIGLALTLFPAFGLLLVVWAATGKSDPAIALWSLGSRSLAYLGLLIFSAFAIAVIATIGRDVECASRALGSGPIISEPTPTDRISMASAEGSFVESLRTKGFRVFRLRLPGWQAAFLASVGLLLTCGVLKVVLTARALPTVSMLPAQVAPEVVAGAVIVPALEPVIAPLVPSLDENDPVDKAEPGVEAPVEVAAPQAAPRLHKGDRVARKQLRAEVRRQRRKAWRAKLKQVRAQRPAKKSRGAAPEVRAQRPEKKAGGALPAWEAASSGVRPQAKRDAAPSPAKPTPKAPEPKQIPAKAAGKPSEKPRSADDDSLDALMEKVLQNEK